MKKRSVLTVACALAGAMGLANAKDFDPRAFGAKGDGVTKDTAAIQKAIDACSKSGGGEVKLAGGTFLSGMVQLKDGVILDIAADATLLGSTNGADFAFDVDLRHLDNKRVCRGRSTALIVADECRNVGITGRGTIDCNGMAFVKLSNSLEYGYENEGNGKTGDALAEDEWVNWRYRRIPGKMAPPRMVLFAGCQDVKVTDVSLVRQCAGWGFWVNDCDRVVFDRVKIISNPELPNNDGIHVNCSRDVSIANCRIEAGDDALVFRANHRPFRSGGPRPCERITVMNCQLTSRANCIRIGWLNDGVVRNATFSNLTMTDSACGIGIDLPPFEKGMDDYGDEASLYENLVFDSIVMDRVHAAPIRIDVTDKAFTRLEAIRNVTFSNIRARAYRWPSIRNLKRDRPLENITFSNCSFTRCADGAFPNPWKQMGAAYWWYRDGESFCGVKGVRLDGCTFEEENSYWRGIPLVDISADAERQVVVAEGAKNRYEGHPTTLLADDGRTMFCVWTTGHGGPCGQMARSDDGGRTWTRLDATLPEAYRRTHRNCPTLQKIKGPDGKTRYFIFSAKVEDNAKAALASNAKRSLLGLAILVSEDGGRTWRESPHQPQLWSAMPPTGFMALKDGTVALFGQRPHVAEGFKDRSDQDQDVWMSVSKDGGFTWSEMRTVASRKNRNLCEPCCIRSPDGNSLALVMRENRHEGRSMMCFSDDEGKTWTKPVSTPACLTGDRHEAIVLPDGRLLVAYRNQALNDPLRGQYMAWVGTWDDLRNGRPGQYQIRLLNHHGRDGWPGNWMDTGYSGVELLPDGTIVCTTYSRHFDDERMNSVVSTRFTIAETDAKSGLSR